MLQCPRCGRQFPDDIHVCPDDFAPLQADVTIALPILASALATTVPPILARRKAPVFTLASRAMTIDGRSVPNDHFEEVNEPAV